MTPQRKKPHRQSDLTGGSAPTAKATTPRFADKPWLLAILLVLLAFVAYKPVFRAGFIWDDDDHLTANPTMTAPHGLRMIWSSLTYSRYYPLTLTTFWAERQLWGLNSGPFHMVNVAFHAANGILIFLILRRLRLPGAWLAAAVWVLHPVNVESVAWVTELKNTQSGLFFFLSVFCFLRFDGERNNHWYVAAVVCGLAAMLSKPSTVVLPLVLLLCAWWKHGKWQRGDVIRIIPFFGLALAMSALTVIEQRGHVLRAGATAWRLAPAERLLIAGKAVWFYALKVLWPVPLTFVYPRWQVSSGSILAGLPLMGLIVVGWILWRRRSEPWYQAVWFGCAFFVAALLPVLGFFDVFYFRYSFVADHFQYLACVGLMTLVASGGTILCERKGRLAQQVGTVAAVLLLLVLGMLTWRQTHIYHDAETLWRDTIAKNPQCWMAHNNLGTVLFESGRATEAIAECSDAVRLKPDDSEPHFNLGHILASVGRVQEAITNYQEILRINPNSADSYNDLGNALLQLGKFQEAITDFVQALRIKPDFAQAQNNLGSAFARTGNLPEAIVHFQEALRIKPDYPNAHYNLGNALEEAGRVEEAAAQFQEALRLNPGFTQAKLKLARLQSTK